jgi:feruloyl-CoA synthase
VSAAVSAAGASRIRPVALGNLDCHFEEHADGTIIARSVHALGPYPRRLTERLEHWARVAPDRVYLARRDHGGDWVRVTYAQALQKVRAIGTALLRRDLSPERPVAILSGNSIEHALLALACLHVGVPYTPVSVAYSLVSTDFGKLRHIIGLTTPGLVFADDGAQYAKAIGAVVPDDVEVVCVQQPSNDRAMTLFETLLATEPDAAVDAAAARVGPEHIAKFLFTSGSTGVPKGVINTQQMWCSNQQMILQSFPFLGDEPPVLVDWTPWNHTFGGNHDFGLILYNGGTLWIDDGKPVAGLVEESVRNLREIAPTWYLNVPKGFEEVLPYLKRERQLREKFFSRVKLLFYAGAALAQHVIDAYDELAIETIGARVQWMAGFGSTETAPFCLVCHADNVKAGAVGLPAAGVELKLAPVSDKLEARVRGPHITPGYWRAPEVTAAAYDEDGWYKFGDAMKWWDPARKDLGFAFDGRITEDFKLATGTWVSVGPLRAKLIANLAPYLKDVVVAGINRDYVSVLIVPDVKACQSLCDFSDDPLGDPATHATFREMLEAFAKTSTGSSNRVMRAIVMREPLDIDAGEVTDKGSINQRAVLTKRAALVERLYAEPPAPDVITIGRR